MPLDDPSVAELADELKSEADRLLNVDPDQTLGLADQICELGATDEAVQALGLLTRGDALRVLGRHSEAVEAYQASARLYRSVGDEVGWARTRIGIAISVRYAGSPSQVLAELGEARLILSQHKLWLRLARLENHAGLLLAGLGHGDEAIAAHERARAVASRLESPNELFEAEVLFNLSVAHYQLDDHERAEGFLKQALSIFEREGQFDFLARGHRNLARYAAGRGEYSKALATVLPGRRTLLEAGRTEAAAHLGQVGVDCLIRLNRPAEAAELAAQVVAEFESTGSRIEAALSRRLYSQALAQLGQMEAALTHLDEAERQYGTSEWESGPANVRLGRAVVLSEMGEWSRALQEAGAACEELGRRGWVAGAAQAQLVRGRALRKLGKPSDALAAANAALDLVRDRPLPWLRYQAWRLLGDLACDTGARAAALQNFLESITCLEQVQGRILTEYRASFLADKADVYEAAVDLLLQDGDVERAFDLVERAKSRALVDALAGGLDIRVRARTPEQSQLVEELSQLRREHDGYVEETQSQPEARELEKRITRLLEELRLAGASDLERLGLLEGRVYSPQSQLDAHTALVEIYRVGLDLIVFIMDGQCIRARRLVDAVSRLSRLEVALQLNLRTAIAEPARRGALEPNARALLQRAYDVLLRPVSEWLHKYERLVIVPHGRLHQLPFGALHDGNSYLIERFELSAAPSASSLTFCLRPRTRDGRHALIGAHSGDGKLPGAVEEARAVASLYEAETLLEHELTLVKLKDRARDADLIHLAAHGVSRLDAPLFSYVQLADGHLTALDCFDLELDCALVTLSACESGRGFVAPGDEQIGFPRAFLYAGARSVLHTLWRIDDRVTQRLMTDFYSGLRVGLSKSAALRDAQLAALRLDGTHPFVWAPFVLMGDWREVDVA